MYLGRPGVYGRLRSLEKRDCCSLKAKQKSCSLSSWSPTFSRAACPAGACLQAQEKLLMLEQNKIGCGVQPFPRNESFSNSHPFHPSIHCTLGLSFPGTTVIDQALIGFPVHPFALRQGVLKQPGMLGNSLSLSEG